jgi:hypothetical protein
MAKYEENMRRYLLGELSESEQSALEEKYFSDPEVFNQILKTESELVDAYARDQLPKELRDRIEKFYMDHPSRAERVKFAKAFTKRVDKVNEPVASTDRRTSVSWWQRLLALLSGQPPAFRLSMAVVILLIVLGGTWVYLERRRQESEAARIQAANEAQQHEREQSQRATEERKRAEELAAKGSTQPTPEASPTQKTNSGSRSVSLALTVGGVRGGSSGQVPTLVLASDTTQVHLLLNLKESGYPTYRATLQTIGGVEVFRQTNLKPRRSPSFTFTVPANKLQSGEYVFTLTGVSADGETENLSKSLFRVEKK